MFGCHGISQALETGSGRIYLIEASISMQLSGDEILLEFRAE
jgi:hypothetical protein